MISATLPLSPLHQDRPFSSSLSGCGKPEPPRQAISIFRYYTYLDKACTSFPRSHPAARARRRVRFAARCDMYVMGTDRKPWSTSETSALITLREEMKPKFLTMKRNRTLWVELSDKLRKHFGHDRTASQCAVRWKNIIAAYKDSRETLKSSGPDGRVCPFFREVEKILGDPFLPIPHVAQEGMRLEDTTQPHAEAVAAAAAAASAQAHAVATGGEAAVSTVPSMQYLHARSSRREREAATVVSMLTDLRAVVETQGRAIARMEKMVAKIAGEGATVQATAAYEDADEGDGVALMDDTAGGEIVAEEDTDAVGVAGPDIHISSGDGGERVAADVGQEGMALDENGAAEGPETRGSSLAREGGVDGQAGDRGDMGDQGTDVQAVPPQAVETRNVEGHGGEGQGPEGHEANEGGTETQDAETSNIEIDCDGEAQEGGGDGKQEEAEEEDEEEEVEEQRASKKVRLETALTAKF